MKKSTGAVPPVRKPRQNGSGGTVKPPTKQGPKRKLPQPMANPKPVKTSQDEDVHKDSAKLSLVRYINDTMIKKMAGKTELRDITSLSLTLTTRDDGKKIRYIENLEGLINLQVLTMSHNQISKIERLHHLTRLRELDLSCNRIGKVDGLETLLHLQTLNLSHNLIETIPPWLSKKLKALRVLHIAGNLLYSLSDVFRLRPLKDLVQLSIADNALCDLPHHRIYAVFHLRTLQLLDRQPVTETERQQANQRFEQGELENLEVQLGQEEKKLRSLQEDHDKTVTEQKQSKTLISSLKSRNLEHQRTNIQLQGELQAQTNLLKRKTAELNKACQKQYMLEQELAFQKIDAKFEPFEFRNDSYETDGGTEESPYIGKAGYKRNRLVHEGHVTPKSRGIRETQQRGHQDASQTTLSPETHGQLDTILQDRLNDKQRQIATAQDQLSKLQDKIDDAEKALGDKNREMQRLSADPSSRPLSEAEKQELTRRLWERLEAVKDLRHRVAELESAMGETLDIIQEREKEMERLRRQRPSSRHPRYAEAVTEIANAERETADAGDKYRDLQQELEEVVDLLAQEMENINQVKQQMAKDKVELNDELKGELEDAAAGLTAYMRESQLRATAQERQNADLRRERDDLRERLRQAESLRKGSSDHPDRRGRDDYLHDFEDVEEMQMKLDAAEEALAAAEAEKDELRSSLNTEKRRQHDAKDERLRTAEEEAKKLDGALKRLKKQAQAETDALKRQLDAQRSQVENLRQSADQSLDPEELDQLTNQLQTLQAERDELEDQLHDLRAQSQDALDASLRPDDVIARVDQLRRHLEHGRGKTRPVDEGDVLGRSLAEVEETVRDRLRKTVGDRQEARRKQQQAEQEADALRGQVGALQEQLEQAERDRLRHGADTPDLNKQDMADGKGRDGRDERDRMEEDAVVEAMRKEVRRLQDKLRQRPAPQHSEQMSRLPPRHDPHTLAELQHLEAALLDTQRQMRGNDQLAADELARSEAEMRQLQDELSHQMQQAQDRERDRDRQLEEQRREADRQTQQALAEAESRARGRAQQAAQELARAEDQMGRLQQALADRETRLQREMQRGDLASQTVADQQTEIGALYDTLEDQKAEMLKLHEALDRLLAPQPGVYRPASTDNDLEHLLSEIERLNHALQQQRNYMSHPGTHVSGPRPLNDLRPAMGGDHHPGSRPLPYRYDPTPSQLLGDTVHRLPSSVPPIPPSRLPPPPASAQQTIPQRHPDIPSVPYSRGVPADVNAAGHPQSRDGRGFPTAVPNPQGVNSLPPGNVQRAAPRGDVRAVPASYNPQPGDQGQQMPQAGIATMPNDQPGDQGHQMPQARIATMPIDQPVVGSVPVGPVVSQQSSTWHQQNVSRSYPSGTVLKPSTETTQWAGNTPGVLGGTGVVQNVPAPTLGVAPPSSQPIMAPVLLAAVQGGPTPGLVLGVPTQGTAARKLAISSGDGGDDDALTGNGTADTSTEDPESAVLPDGGRPSRTIVLPPGGLFCNVPEHHDMEDEIARLKKLLAECRKSKKRRADSGLEKMESILEDRNKEQESLELAIKRQHEVLRTLHDADADLQRKRDKAAQELQELNANIDRKTRRRDFLEGRGTITPEEADYEVLEASLDQDYIEDEIECLERTLRKRRAELRVADRLLQECQADLKDATDTARSTLERYDRASLDLKRAREDAEEIEKRSVQAAKDLVGAQERLAEMQQDVARMEEEWQSRKEQMRAVDEVLTEKDRTFKGLEAKIEQASDRLQKLQTDLLLTEENVAEKQENARQQTQIIADRRAELHRLEEQVDEETVRLSELDREIGRKQADLQGLTSDLEANHKEMVAALRDAENELVSLKQKVKETKAVLDDLVHQKRDLQSSIEDQRDTLSRQHQETEQEDRALQDLRASMGKGQAELKHTLEMIQLEKTDLEALRLQHETKMGDLEKTQLMALQERAELETIQVTCQEKRGELERVSKQLGLQRSEKERLTAETTAMEARATTLHREEESLEDRCRQWDGKVAQLTRQHADLLDARKAEESRLEELERSATVGHEDLDKISSKRALLTAQIGSYKQQVKETAKELKLAMEELQNVEDRKHHTQQELQEQERQKSEARGDLAELRASVEKTQHALQRVTEEHRIKQEALHRLRREVAERHQEAENGQQHVERVQADVEQEENRLSRLIGGLTVEAEHLKSDITSKRQELEEARLRLLEMHAQHEQHQQNRQTVAELQAHITQLESEVKERVVEKTSLAETVNFSHVEINSLRKEKESLKKRLSEMTSQLDANRERQRQAKQRFKVRQRELEQEIEEANLAANEHCSQADRLSVRLKEVTQQYLQQQSQSSRELEEERRAKAEALEKLRELSRREEASSIDETSDLEELDDLQQQKMDLTRHLVELKSNIQQARLDASLIRDGDFLDDLTSADESRWRQDQEKTKMQAEQDRLKLQIRQRVSSQASVLDSVKDRANSTLHSLKRKLDNLEGLVSSNSAMTRSLTGAEVSLDSDMSLNQYGLLGSDHLPQRDVPPTKMTSRDPRPRGILKSSQQQPAAGLREGHVDESPPSPGPSHTYSSQRHRRTSPSREEHHTQRHRVVDSDRHRYDDFMDSLQRLKEEKLAQIERSSHISSKSTR